MPILSCLIKADCYNHMITALLLHVFFSGSTIYSCTAAKKGLFIQHYIVLEFMAIYQL